jgi:hypothetical protein
MNTSEPPLVYDPATGRSDVFSGERLYATVTSACHVIGMADGIIPETAARVCRAIETWLGERAEVTRSDIRRRTSEQLAIMSAEAGYMLDNKNAIM